MLATDLSDNAVSKTKESKMNESADQNTYGKVLKYIDESRAIMQNTKLWHWISKAFRCTGLFQWYIYFYKREFPGTGVVATSLFYH